MPLPWAADGPTAGEEHLMVLGAPGFLSPAVRFVPRPC